MTWRWGMLADLSAEHYSWVATGDEANPDASTVMEHLDSEFKALWNSTLRPEASRSTWEPLGDH